MDPKFIFIEGLAVHLGSKKILTELVYMPSSLSSRIRAAHKNICTAGYYETTLLHLLSFGNSYRRGLQYCSCYGKKVNDGQSMGSIH